MFAAMAFYLLKIHKVIQTMSKKRMAQKIADTLRTRMLGKSPVCHNSVVGKKAKCWEAANSASSGAKSKFPGKKKSFQPMLFARLARRTREHQPERIACLGIESSGIRTHGRLLRRQLLYPTELLAHVPETR